MSEWIAAALVLGPLLLAGYAFAGYPLLLAFLTRVGGRRRGGEDDGDGRSSSGEDPQEWPRISVCLPAHNEASIIRDTLEQLLAIDYPEERTQIIVVSDASTDGTDDIVREYADRGVEHIRLPERRGKTAAENAAVPHLDGEIIVNVDASVRVPPPSVRKLVRALRDPTVGVASGRDVSVSDTESEANYGEEGYVNYEMWVRSLETAAGSIIGASGCFYAIRRDLHALPTPDHLSRDFLAVLRARIAGYRSVSVNDAVVFVPRTPSLSRELRRKSRTMARGMSTLWHVRELLNPLRYGLFAVQLWSHKVLRWVVPVALIPAAVGATYFLYDSWPGRIVLALAAAGGLLGAWALSSSRTEEEIPQLAALAGYALASNLGVILAWAKTATQSRALATWEPTRRS